ncbi:MAG: phage virion morphogenesis protein [Verrucomicrobiota bacterium]|nr:phage virion morphogenesis protein [Verrucomicrobiota bacterium]
MRLTFRNLITPGLLRLKGAPTTPILEAMGLQLVSITKRAFNSAELRPSPWAPVKKKTGAPLKRSGALWQSIRIVDVNEKTVTVGTDRPYAAYHQFGTKHIPARPFFPFDASGKITPRALDLLRKVAAKRIQRDRQTII